ncbi:MAG: hypothetical protein K6U79_05450 [Firmicutes bacterium]|nr:hypothetical protein [Bacillota bacterium]
MERREPGVGKDLWGIGASLAALLGGLWLMVAPWALAFQSRGAAWSDATRNSFWSGLGVAVVALAGLLLFAGNLAAQLRDAGVLAGPRRELREREEGGARAGETARLEEALVPLAARLLEELAAQQRGEEPPARSPSQEAFSNGGLRREPAERGERL